MKKLLIAWASIILSLGSVQSASYFLDPVYSNLLLHHLFDIVGFVDIGTAVKVLLDTPEESKSFIVPGAYLHDEQIGKYRLQFSQDLYFYVNRCAQYDFTAEMDGVRYRFATFLTPYTNQKLYVRCGEHDLIKKSSSYYAQDAMLHIYASIAGIAGTIDYKNNTTTKTLMLISKEECERLARYSRDPYAVSASDGFTCDDPTRHIKLQGVLAGILFS